MEQHQHLSVNELNKGKCFILSYLLWFLLSYWWFRLVVFDEFSHSHIHTLVAIIIDLNVLSNFIVSFFFHQLCCWIWFHLFFCAIMLLHYLKLESSWLKCEATWVAYSNLISHICMPVTIIVQYGIIFFFLSCHPTCYHHFFLCATDCCLSLKLKSSWLRHEVTHWVASSTLLSSWSYNPFPYPLNLKLISYPILVFVLLLLL
jgi:hypothetical protein